MRIFDEFFPGFRAKFRKIVTCVAFSTKFAKTNQKFAENSEFCENYSVLFKIIHLCPYCARASGPGAAGGAARRDLLQVCDGGAAERLQEAEVGGSQKILLLTCSVRYFYTIF